MPCECKNALEHIEACGVSDEVSADTFMEKYSEKYSDADIECYWDARPNDKLFVTNAIGFLAACRFTAARLEKVKRLATKHPHLLNGGEHPPLTMALDRMLYTSKGVVRDVADGQSGKKWLQELVALGACTHEGGKKLVILKEKHKNDLETLKEKHENDLEIFKNKIKTAKEVSIPQLIWLKEEAQLQVADLKEMTVERCYGPFIEAAEQQIRESQRVAAKAHQLDQHMQGIIARVEAVRKDLAAVSSEGTDVGERDVTRARLLSTFPQERNEMKLALGHRLSSEGRIKTWGMGSNTVFLTQFASRFETVRQCMLSRLVACISRTDTLFDSLSSSTQPPKTLTKLGVALHDTTMFCSLTAFCKQMDRLCPRVALADLGKEVALSKQELVNRVEALRTEVERMEASFRQHVEQPLRFASTSEEAGVKVDELLEAAEEVDRAQHTLNRVIKGRLRLRSATSADEEVAEATARKQQVMRAYRAKAALYVGPLLRHFPEYRQTLTEGLQLPTVVTAADSPTDSLLTLEDFTLEGNVTDEVMFATLKTDSTATESRKRGRDDCDVSRTGGQKCVLKRFSDELHLMRELTAIRCVRHPFVVTVGGAFHDGGHCYLWMPKYEGGTLMDWLQLHQGDAEAVLRVLYQIASGLSAVHMAGVIHCDMKPANVVMTSNSIGAHPCLIDFDFAAPDEARTDGTMGLALLGIGRTMVLGGTRRYLAPEMCDATVAPALCTPNIDAYSLGIVLWMDVLESNATPSQTSEDNSPAEFPAEGNCVCADTLRPYKDVLMPLITQLTVRDPSERCTVAEAEGVLRGLWERARAKQHDEVAAAQRPVACVTCMGQQAARQTAECRGGHRYCGECVVNLVGTQRESNDWMEHYRKGGVKCVMTGCAEVVPLESLETAVSGMEEGVAALRQMAEDVGAVEAVVAYKWQQEKESAVRKALRELDETVLNLRCPSRTCGKLVHIDFTECMSLQCPHCQTIFCAWCSETQRNSVEGHRHVHNCGENAAPRRGLYCNDPAVWWRHWEGRRRAAVERYLRDLPEEVAVILRPRIHLLDGNE